MSAHTHTHTEFGDKLVYSEKTPRSVQPLELSREPEVAGKGRSGDISCAGSEGKRPGRGAPGFGLLVLGGDGRAPSLPLGWTGTVFLTARNVVGARSVGEGHPAPGGQASAKRSLNNGAPSHGTADWERTGTCYCRSSCF